MIKNYLSRTLNKYMNKYFEEINSNDLEYGLLSGKVKMKNLTFKQDALRAFGEFVVRNSKTEEVTVKYNWNLLGKDSNHIIVKDTHLNIETTQVSTLEDNESQEKVKDITMHIELINVNVGFDGIRMNIDKLSLRDCELSHKKLIELYDVKVINKSRTLLHVPLIMGDVDTKQLLSTIVALTIPKIQCCVTYKHLQDILKMKKCVLENLKQKKSRQSFTLTVSIAIIVLDFTDIKKRLICKNASAVLSKKLKICVDRIIGITLSNRKKLYKRLGYQKELDIANLLLDKNMLKAGKLFMNLDPIYCFTYYKPLLSQVNSAKKGREGFVIVLLCASIRTCGVPFMFYDTRIELINESLEGYNAFNCVLKTRNLQCDEFIEVNLIKIAYEDKKLHADVGNIAINLDNADLKKVYKFYKRYLVGDGSIDINYSQYIKNFKVSYGSNKTLCDLYGIEVNVNSTKKANIYSFLSVSTENGSRIDILKHKNRTIASISDLYIDLNILLDFYSGYVLPKQGLIFDILNDMGTGDEKARIPVYLYGTTLVYEDFTLCIDYFEYSQSLKTIFSLYLEEKKYVLVDKAHFNLVYGDILQIRSSNHLRINISNYIVKRFRELINTMVNEVPIISCNEKSVGLDWMVCIDSASLHLFTDQLDEILASHITNIKICDIKEHSVDGIVKKLYFKIEDLQVDDQNYKNIFPVVVYKTSCDHFIEGSILYYLNTSTIFVIKTDVKVCEVSVNIEETLLLCVFEIFNVKDGTHCSKLPIEECDTVSLYNTCITVKDLMIQELNIKINWIRKAGGGVKDRLLVFCMNNISDFNVRTDTCLILHQRTTLSGLFNTLSEFYKEQFYNNCFKVVGHLDLLGNVGTFANGITGTFKDNVKKQTGFIKGTGNILKNTFFGMTKTIGKISSSVKNNAGLLTFDKEFNESLKAHPFACDKNLPLAHRKNNIKSIELLMKGTEKMISSVYSGIIGVAKKPIDGYQKGFTGAFIGLGKGVVGAISKPVVGASGLLVNCTEILGGGSEPKLRISYPLVSKDSIGHFDLGLSAAYYVFRVHLRHLKNELFVDGSLGDIGGDAIVLLTNIRLIISTDYTVTSIEPKDVFYDSRDVNGFYLDDCYVKVYRKDFLTSLRKAIQDC